MHIDKLPRFPLAQLPTPIETLPRLSHELGGPDLLIKRDDQTGLALGGNKTRKLEFLVGDALAHGADTLVTVGAAQSNHCRQTAAAAARAGFQCELILNGTKPDLPNGNVLLNQLFGATEHWIDRTQRTAKLRELPEQLRAQEAATDYLNTKITKDDIVAVMLYASRINVLTDFTGDRDSKVSDEWGDQPLPDQQGIKSGSKSVRRWDK